MALLTKETYKPELSEGWHESLIQNIDELSNVETPYGTRDLLELHFRTKSNKVLRRRFSKSISSKSKLTEVIKASLGKEPGKSFDTNMLIGATLQIFVEHSEEDAAGNIWERVARFKKSESPIIVDNEGLTLESELPW